MNNKTFSISSLVMLATLLSIFLVDRRGEPTVVRTNLENLPMVISGYIGNEDSFTDSVYQELNADKHIYRHYRTPEGSPIDLYIGYYGTAKGGRTGHSPNACLLGAGWAIIEDRKTDVAFGEEGTTVNRLVAKNGNSYETVLHWYQSDKNKIITTGIQQNIQRLVGRIIYNRNDGAFVRLSMQTDREGLEIAKQKLSQFAAMILGILPEYWPEEE